MITFTSHVILAMYIINALHMWCKTTVVKIDGFYYSYYIHSILTHHYIKAKQICKNKNVENQTFYIVELYIIALYL